MRDRKHARRRDSGETLLEVVLTVLITAITITALVSALATTGSAGQAQRNSVNVDAVMRNYAEATKAAARNCVGVATTYAVAYSAPTGFTATASPPGSACPPLVTLTTTLTLTTTGPGGIKQTMQIKIRRQ
jgi:Tfp pilus assembly protein PilV